MNATTMTWPVQKVQSKNAVSGPAATVWPVRGHKVFKHSE